MTGQGQFTADRAFDRARPHWVDRESRSKEREGTWLMVTLKDMRSERKTTKKRQLEAFVVTDKLHCPVALKVVGSITKLECTGIQV